MTANSPDRAQPPSPDAVDRMREHWRGFAREDAMYYVSTNRAEWNVEDFYADGRPLVEEMLAWAGDDLGRGRMVEIGCGAGRLVVHFAREFERVEGFDIAPEMIELARAHVPDNVNLTVNSGADLRPLDDASVDFVFSTQVFQHIPDREVLAKYVAETARVLRPGGRAILHFDTRVPSLARRLAMLLPDPLLPRTRRRYIRRYPVAPEWPAEQAAAVGLHLLDERAPRTQWHLLRLELTDAG